jgi:hypothetical protein
MVVLKREIITLIVICISDSQCNIAIVSMIVNVMVQL